MYLSRHWFPPLLTCHFLLQVKHFTSIAGVQFFVSSSTMSVPTTLSKFVFKVMVDVRSLIHYLTNRVSSRYCNSLLRHARAEHLSVSLCTISSGELSYGILYFRFTLAGSSTWSLVYIVEMLIRSSPVQPKNK